MGRYIVRRLIYSIPVLLIASILVFVVVRSTVNPAAALRGNPRVTAEQQQRYAEDLGLNDPLPTQYWKWLSSFLQGDWGTSLLTNIPVFPQIRDAMINSLILGLTASVVSLLFGVAIGLYSSLHQYSKFDNIATTGAVLGPVDADFWFALILQLVLRRWLTKWLNLSSRSCTRLAGSTPGGHGFDLLARLQHLALPVIVVSVQVIAIYSRYMRARMLEVMRADYLRTARAKGLRERRVVIRHAMRNALIPLTTRSRSTSAPSPAGSIVTEDDLRVPGDGHAVHRRLGVKGTTRDPAVADGDVHFVILFNLVADIAVRGARSEDPAMPEPRNGSRVAESPAREPPARAA